METIPENEPLSTFTPFDNIALAFSGGGFRAASFNLGVLSYLDILQQENGTPLLHNVTFIASASGGTITNALYALEQANGSTFGVFYKKLLEALQGTDLLDEVFRILNDDSQWTMRPNKQRNIINAFALAYDKLLFDKALLGNLYRRDTDTHLEEVCFNTTEFYRGLLFRQNIKMKYDSAFGKDTHFRYGNFAINLGYHAAKRLKLSDLLAASSCFPAGFEPIIFPDDFTYGVPDTTAKDGNTGLDAGTLLKYLKVELKQMDRQELKRLYGDRVADDIIARLPPDPTPENIRKAFKEEGITDSFKIGMMDGGITDNQALESTLDAHNRRMSGNTDFKPFDLMLINDVDSDFMDPYTPATTKESYTGLKGITINTTILILAFLCLAGIVLTAGGFTFCHCSGLAERLCIMGGMTLLLLSALLLGLLFFIRTYVRGNIGNLGGLDLDRNFSPEIVNNLFQHFGATPIMVIFRMLRERGSSLLLLNNDVFLKRIRFLLYNAAYRGGRYASRLKTNHAYDLSFSNDSTRSVIESIASPGKNIQTVAQTAFEMRTTLWFDSRNQQSGTLATLVACGQFTTCYNLLEYIYRLKTNRRRDGMTYFERLSQQYRQKVDFLEDRLKKDYEAFRQDPFWLYNRNGHSFDIKDFKDCTVDSFPFPEEEFGGLR